MTVKIEKLEDIKKIPSNPGLRANRYDSDDHHILHIWDQNENSYDIMVPKIGRIGCHSIKPNNGIGYTITLCESCDFKPDDEHCRNVMAHSRKRPLFKGQLEGY